MKILGKYRNSSLEMLLMFYVFSTSEFYLDDAISIKSAKLYICRCTPGAPLVTS